MQSQHNLIVSTCGISLLTHQTDDSLRGLLNRCSNAAEKELPSGDKAVIDDHIQFRIAQFAAAGIEEARRYSAEINGICAYYGGNLSLAGTSRHIFIHSDTYLGERCAHFIAQWCEKQGLPVETRRIRDMNTANFTSFQTAMSDLAHWCITQIAPQRAPHCRVVFNLTGGFKSLQGYMQTLGMFYADEIVYLFESSKELLRIPRLPLNIDSSALAEIRDNFATYRRLSLNAPVMDLQGSNISESMLFTMENEGYSLSPWGQIFWDRYRQEHYGDVLLPTPLPERIVFGPDFLKQAARFKSDSGKLTELNERMDDLAKFLLNNMRDCPKRLSFKALKGTPVPGSTHEFYAWSTGGAWRVFCHFEGDVVHIDTLREHL